MNILYIASKTPYPAYDGGAVAAMSFIELLQTHGQVDGIIVSTKKHPFTNESQTKLSNYFQELAPVQVDTSIKPWKAFSALFSGKNYNLARFKSTELHQKIVNQLAMKQYDWVVCDSLFAAVDLPQLDQGTRLAIRTHNVEFEIWENLSKSAKNPLKRWYLKQLAKTLKREELAILNKAQTLFTISSIDHLRLQTLLPHKVLVTLPVVIPTAENPLTNINPEVFHLGSMDWLPNIEAVNILEKLFLESSRLKQIRLNLAGKNLNKSLYAAPNITNFGEVASSEAFMKNAGILVAPIFSGSGIRIKILEALALGIPVVTTPLGASGIDIQASGIVCATSFESFEDAIYMLIENNELRIELGHKGFMYIRNQHSLKQATAILGQALGR